MFGDEINRQEAAEWTPALKERLKPAVLYHASRNRNIEVFEPRAESVRHPEEGPVVFAAEDEVYACKFLVPSDDSWAKLSRFGKVHVAVYADKARFFENDKGGAVYELPSDSFELDPKFSGSTVEWTSKSPVKPIKKIVYESGFQAMLDNRVQVYFITPEQLQSMKDAPDHGYAIIKTLESENAKLNKNVIPLK
ncbi:hypothetical protein C4561_03365 [candidate division WWE3 bacterium]|jgi:hypothetical protein|uniref:Uncharacterized protein n=1 Tax=candidate division WWE3 bacterium TaxID=2053526 RepID=A0A3A4ZC00_UNCKA|nr:MAG: hypothetical protein C4561_03365 [candidate division WWE3 bacterium]